ncbi:hypothetical protein [Cyanobium sp. PCC 7001]|uniref:hypothetical protein n=1 Tax=Cyanobium sp. PCC 7001 TaxID=180281 RepID=UPI0005BC8CD8|nr:hypothetical protein [Cyanobium sp. PCC 7001]
MPQSEAGIETRQVLALGWWAALGLGLLTRFLPPGQAPPRAKDSTQLPPEVGELHCVFHPGVLAPAAVRLEHLPQVGLINLGIRTERVRHQAGIRELTDAVASCSSFRFTQTEQSLWVVLGQDCFQLEGGHGHRPAHGLAADDAVFRGGTDQIGSQHGIRVSTPLQGLQGEASA